MKRVFIAMALVLCSASLVFSASENDLWLKSSESPMQLQVVARNMINTVLPIDDLKGGGEVTLGGPGPVFMGTSNVIMDCYTAPYGSPTMWEYEGYSSFSPQSTIAHVMYVKSGPGLVATGYAWTDCTADVYFPPIPATLGIAPFGSPVLWTLPATGNWLLGIGIYGFSPGRYDWICLANYAWEGCGETEGMIVGPELMLPVSGIDIHGGSIAPDHNDPRFNLHTEPGCLGAVGDGKGASRPWCFEVHY
jgi:hypothetical protein